MSEKILFLTGKLAERQLKRILSSMKPEFRYKINQIGVNVAALMSENIIIISTLKILRICLRFRKYINLLNFNKIKQTL